MTEAKTPQLSNDWRAVAQSIKRTLRPTTRVTLLGDEYMLRSEARHDSSDRDYHVLRQLARGKRCVLDVGANVGLTSLVMSRGELAPDGHIFAFEASEIACHLIRDNIVLNGLAERITVVNALVAERSGLAIDFFGDAASGGASIIAGYLGHHRPLRKASLALDDFVSSADCVPDLIKIDVEGAELRVIEGLASTMRSARPLLFIELHSWGDLVVPDTAAALLRQLAPLDYCLIYLRTKKVITDPAVLSGRGRCHVLACPAESPFLGHLAELNTEGL